MARETVAGGIISYGASCEELSAERRMGTKEENGPGGDTFLYQHD